MTINDIRSSLKEYAKDIKLNLSNVLSEEGSEGLSQNQIYGIALSCAYTTKNNQLIGAISKDAKEILSDEEVSAAKAASTIMAMNNIYYRFVHLVSDSEYKKLPAKLRMNVIANSGVDKIDFEIYSLAVSAINGCGMCIDAHVHELKKAGVAKESIQSSIRIASVINATSQALTIN